MSEKFFKKMKSCKSNPLKKSQHKTVVVVYDVVLGRGRAGVGKWVGTLVRACRGVGAGCDRVLAGDSCLSRDDSVNKEACTAHTLSVCSSLQNPVLE